MKIEELIDEYVEVKKQIENLELRRKALRQVIVDDYKQYGENPHLYFNKLAVVTKDVEDIDSYKLKIEEPDIYDKYLKITKTPYLYASDAAINRFMRENEED